MPHAPGPPGTPQLAHGLSAGILAADDPPCTLTANVDSCFSRRSPWHLGHDGATPARVNCSNRCPHDSQRYSNSGIQMILDRPAAPLVASCPAAVIFLRS
jgi:hypothetical protein